MTERELATNYRWRAYGQVIQIERVEPYYGCFAVINPNGHSDRGIPTKEDRTIADRIVNALNQQRGQP